MFRRTYIGEPGPWESERGEVVGECAGETTRDAVLDAERE